MNLNPREKQRQEIFRRIIRSITQFETQLINERHSRECVYHIFLSVYHQRIRCERGVIFSEPYERRIDHFLETNVRPLLREFAGGNIEELKGLEGRVLGHFADVIRQILNANLLRKDVEHQSATAVTN